MTIYALRASGNEQRIVDGLGKGEGRFGWSYVQTADLHELQRRIQAHGWSSLTPEEQDCNQQFLLQFKAGDHVVYINVPTYGECTTARLTGPYFWRWDDSDFNHRFPIDVASVQTFSRTDSRVEPALESRLRLQSRQWRIKTEREFQNLLDGLAAGGPARQRTASDHASLLRVALEGILLDVTKEVHRTHPRLSLEPLMARVFKSVPGVDATEGMGTHDKGADVIVVYEQVHPLSGRPQKRKCVVQVKSYEQAHWDTQAVDDIRRAFKTHPDANEGLIVSTATEGSSALDDALAELRREFPDRPVDLLLGKDLALYLLQHGWAGLTADPDQA